MNSRPLVLMYHGICDSASLAPPQREAGAELYDLPLQKFSEQMAHLKTGGPDPALIEDALDFPQSAIVLTFDDGEQNNFANAFPVLRQNNFTAYFFITADRVGKKGYMDWEELKELRDAGMLIGSHGKSHVILTELKDKKIEEELSVSKDVLEQHLKINVDCFSVPRGFHNVRVIELAKKVGYKRIFISTPNDCYPEICISRIAVKSDWSLNRFKAALSGQEPISETVGHSIRGTIKKVVGPSGYNGLRTFLLNLRPKKPGGP